MNYKVLIPLLLLTSTFTVCLFLLFSIKIDFKNFEERTTERNYNSITTRLNR